MRTIVIGDIHGCYDELIELISEINVSEEDLIIALGDIVDRGNKSKEVFQFFQNRKNSIVLMGNHERKHLQENLTYAQEIVKLQMDDDYEDFVQWINALPIYYEDDSAKIIHAYYEHDKPLTAQKLEVLIGTSSGNRYLQKKYTNATEWILNYNDSKAIIYGHEVVGNFPKIHHNTFGIDTGCCHGGYLTAIELPQFSIHQVKAKRDYWREEQIKWQIPVLETKEWNQMTFDEIEKLFSKLAYIKDLETIAYINQKLQWIEHTKSQIHTIKDSIDRLTQRMLRDTSIQFNEKANQYDFNRYLYLSKNNNLKVEILENDLNTAYKIHTLIDRLNQIEFN